MKSFFSILSVFCLLYSINTIASNSNFLEVSGTMVINKTSGSWLEFSSTSNAEAGSAEIIVKTLKAKDSSVVKYYRHSTGEERSKEDYQTYVDSISVRNGSTHCIYQHSIYHCQFWF